MLAQRYFNISTLDTSFILAAMDNGLLCQLYYGRRIKPREDYDALVERFDVCYGTGVSYGDDPALGLDDVCLAYAGLGRGDYREPAVQWRLGNGSGSCDLKFVGFEELDEKPHIPGLPSSYDESDDCDSYVFRLRDEAARVSVELYINAFITSNVITQFVKITNDGEAAMTLQRAMSLQLDLQPDAYELITFDGAWALERIRHDKPLSPGVFMNDTKQGANSARHNPFVMLKRKNADELSGECYATNLVYSGNHAEIAEVTHTGKTRLLTGISPSGFEWTLATGESFYTPEAAMTFSCTGFNGISKNMHEFVNESIVRGFWKKKDRPVLVNNWEGTMFDFDQRKILSIAKIAAEVGAELFVLDDGWFGKRDSDTCSLGDWYVNTKKLPESLEGLAKRVNALGMQFGIWVEPEMISEDSDLYRAHPDWAIAAPERAPLRSRNQLVLDLTRQEVRDYVIEAMDGVFSTPGISYVKWDMNRNISDGYSPSLPPQRQGEFFHRYTLGLYAVLEELTKRFPQILFESCASGGNRFDLGMLCYMPQTWASDNTDPVSRQYIQAGTSYGYPLSSIGAHVSASPHSSTLRATPIETRFNTAAFGCFGCEMDLTELSEFDKKCITRQIAYYKQHRRLFQYGRFYRIKTLFDGNFGVWSVVSDDMREGIASFFQKEAVATHTHDVLRLTGFDDELYYDIEGREQYINIKAFGGLIKHVMPVKIRGDGVIHTVLSAHYMYENAKESYRAGGDVLNHAGIRLNQQFGGTGYNEKIRVLGDFGSRMYYIHARTDE